jgi:hypothetical protein
MKVAIPDYKDDLKIPVKLYLFREDEEEKTC